MTTLTHDLDFVLKDYFDMLPLDAGRYPVYQDGVVSSEYLTKYLEQRGYEIRKIED